MLNHSEKINKITKKIKFLEMVSNNQTQTLSWKTIEKHECCITHLIREPYFVLNASSHGLYGNLNKPKGCTNVWTVPTYSCVPFMSPL